VSKLVR